MTFVDCESTKPRRDSMNTEGFMVDDINRPKNTQSTVAEVYILGVRLVISVRLTRGAKFKFISVN